MKANKLTTQTFVCIALSRVMNQRSRLAVISLLSPRKSDGLEISNFITCALATAFQQALFHMQISYDWGQS